MTCVAYGCRNQDGKDRAAHGLTFHRFPHHDAERLRMWVQNVRRADWEPAPRSRLCSKHFTQECFDLTGRTVRLRDNAVPTIFSFPRQIAESSSKIRRKVPNDKGCTADASPATAATAERSLILLDHAYAMHSPQQRVGKRLDDQHSTVKGLQHGERQKGHTPRSKLDHLLSAVNLMLSME